MNKTLLEIAKGIQSEGVQCNCDLDNWEPLDTGHTSVCRIHRLTKIRIMNQELEKFCRICWHEWTDSSDFCVHCKVSRDYYPDFTTPDGYALLHTVMGDERHWARFHRWLHARESSPSRDTFANTVANFHMLQFPKQAKLIYEFIEEDV